MTIAPDEFPALVRRFDDWLMREALPLWAPLVTSFAAGRH